VIHGEAISEKPINPQVVNNIIKKHIDMIGEDPKNYSAHGLRRGFITTCGRLGLLPSDVMDLTDHRDIRTLMVYYEEGRINRNPATRI
jgi:integrase